MTPHRAQPVALPTSGVIVTYLAHADFADAYRITVEYPEHSALQHFERALIHTPRWVRAAMHLRNRAVVLVGLRAAGAWEPRPTRDAAASRSYAVGERLGIFKLMHISDNEVMAGDDDKHLRVLLSLQREPARPGQPAAVLLTTVVHIHNWLGRLYMLPVTPAHRVIAPAVLARVNAA